MNNNFFDLFKTIITPSIESMHDDLKLFQEKNKDSFYGRICKHIRENKVGVEYSLQ